MEQNTTDIHRYYKHFEDTIRYRFLKEEHLNHFLKEMKAAFRWTVQNFTHYPIYHDDGCALVFHSEKETQTGYFGFIIFPKDLKIRNEFWATITSAANEIGAKYLIGPIQGSTFFPYRYVSESDGSAFFKGEFFSHYSEHDFLVSKKPESILTYQSGYRTRFDKIMTMSKPYFDELSNKGLEFKLRSKIDQDLFRQIFELVEIIFKHNWSFQHLSEDEFTKFYSGEILNRSKLMLHTLHFQGNLIGFCRYIENDDKTIICKTLGILPEYQKMGVGAAAVYQIHAEAKNHGYSKIIYALVSDLNRVKNLPQGDEIIFRKYASYEFNL